MLFSGLVSWRGTNTVTRVWASLPVLARDPQHDGLALIVGIAGRDEQKIRKPVDVTECAAATRLLRRCRKRHYEPLGAARDRARKVQEACRLRSARKHEGAQRLKLAVQSVNLAFEPLDLRIRHRQSPPRVLAFVRVAELGAEVEQIVLDARDHGVERVVQSRVQPRKAYCGVGLIERAVAFDTKVEFGHPAP